MSRSASYTILFLLLAIATSAQEFPKKKTDIRLWTGGTVKIEFTKDFRLEVEQQYRIEDTISKFESSFTEVGVRYEFTKWFDAKMQYRYSVNEKERNNTRWSLDLSAEYDIDDFPVDLQYRFRFTDSKVDFTGEKSTYVRNRFGLDWNMSKLVDPYLEYELFYKLNDNNEFRGHRLTFGLEWKLSDEADFETFWRFEDEINVDDPKRQYIIGLMVSYDIELH